MLGRLRERSDGSIEVQVPPPRTDTMRASGEGGVEAPASVLALARVDACLRSDSRFSENCKREYNSMAIVRSRPSVVSTCCHVSCGLVRFPSQRETRKKLLPSRPPK